MTSWKKIFLWAVLLLPVTLTTLFGLLRRQHDQGNHDWLSLGFYAVMMIFSFTVAIVIFYEITGRNKMKEGLRRNTRYAAKEKWGDTNIEHAKEKIDQNKEECTKLLIDSIKDYAIFMIDLNGKVASWNKGAEQIKGYRADEIIGHPIEIFYTDEDIRNHVPEHNLRLAKEKGSYEDEGLRVRKDGSLFWANVIYSALWDEKGYLRGYAKVTKNINRQKQLEGELYKYNIELEAKITERTAEIYYHESRFRALIENNRDIISLLDDSFKSIYRSPSASQITGWTDEDVLKISGEQLIHPDEKQLVGDIFIACMKSPGEAIPVLFRSLHKDGHFIWLEGTITNLLNDGHVNAVVFNVHDATDRILSEEEMRKTYKEIADYKFALDASSIVAITDQDGVITHVNDNFCKISKYSAGELVGQNHSMTSSGFHSKYFIEQIWATIQRGDIWKGETKNKAKDGSSFWVDTTIVPFLDENAKPYQYVAIRTDISERKRAEEVLAASETRFRALIENSAEGIALTDEFSNVLYRSPASAKITGETPAANSISRAHPEDLLSIQTKIKESLNNPGVPVNFQGRFQHSLGHYYWMEGSLTNMLRIEGLNAIVANYRDITKRKETEESLINSEKLYRSLFENMLSGFTYCKGIFEDGRLVDFTYLAVNEQYEIQTGLKNVLGKNVSEVNPGMLESDREYADIISRVALTGKPERFEAYIERLDKWFSTSLYSPATGYFVGLLDNITERKRAEGKINMINIELERKVLRRTEELKKKNEELEAFSYSVSHDLRAPLRGIIGFTTILEEEYSSKLDGEAKRLTDIIKKNTQKMGNLIDDLLTFSRMGRHEIKKTMIDTHIMVEQVISELLQKSVRRPVRWIIGPMQPMLGDIVSMRQVWVNLLSNAQKYSAGQSNPKIEISSYQDGDRTVFMVKDNGVGFDNRYVDKLFKVFQRLHGANEFEGTGVGLAIVEKIISRHAGKVWAEGEVEKGASFFFSLPLK
jgi:PAS domain S-box-containing protein